MASADCRGRRRARSSRPSCSWPQDCHGVRHPARHRGLTATMYAFFAFVAGLVFGIGLIVSQMANPAKVLGFLDLAGRWDPSLAFVMGGAITVAVVGFALARRRPSTLLGTPFAAADGARDRCAPHRRRVAVRRGLGPRGLLSGPRFRRARRGPRRRRWYSSRQCLPECSRSKGSRVRASGLRAAPKRALRERANDADLPPTVRSAVVDLFLSARRSPQPRSGADRSGVRAGATRCRAHPGARPEAGRHARHARARRSCHRRVAAQASAAAARSRSARRAARTEPTASSRTATASRSAIATSRSARRRGTRKAA